MKNNNNICVPLRRMGLKGGECIGGGVGGEGAREIGAEAVFPRSSKSSLCSFPVLSTVEELGVVWSSFLLRSEHKYKTKITGNSNCKLLLKNTNGR